MELTELFSGMAVILVAIIAVFSLVAEYNSVYGEDIATDSAFNNTLTEVQQAIQTDLVVKGTAYGQSTQAEAGQGTATDTQDSALRRGLRTLSLVDDLVGLPAKLIRGGAEALNLPGVYASIGVAIYWIIFSITLMYLLVLGVRRLVP